MAVRNVVSRLHEPNDDVRDPGPAPDLPSGAVLVLAFALGLLLISHDRSPRVAPTRPHECATDPRDFLSAGELLDGSSLRFIVFAHCGSAKVRPDGWIELQYRGAPFGVETHRFGIGQRIYYEIVWVGGVLAP